MDEKNQLFGLMTAAEEQQRASEKALASLHGEITALAKERADLARLAAALKGAGAELGTGARQALDEADKLFPALRAIAEEAIRGGLNRYLDETSKSAVAAVKEAGKPYLDKLIAQAAAADETSAKLRGTLRWFGVRWFAVGGGLVVVLAALFWGLTYAAVGWERHQVADLRGQKEALTAEVVTLQAQADTLAKKGAKIQFSTCGGRMCVKVAKAQYPDGRGIAVAWGNGDDGQWVIPDGY